MAKEVEMEYFQIRKNSQQVLRLYRGVYQGFDVTRMQLWYKKPEDNEYKPGRTVAFNSALIPAVVEGLVRMIRMKPITDTKLDSLDALLKSPPDLTAILQGILKAHKGSLHWENLANIVVQEKPHLTASKWAVYNTLLANPNIFREIEEDVFTLRR